MTAATSVLGLGIELAAVVLTGYFVVAMWKRRAEPTARPLLVVAVTMFAGTVAHLAVVYPTLVERALSAMVPAAVASPLWVGVIHVVVILAAGFWFLFTLQYTGRGGRLFSLAAATVVLAWVLVPAMARFGELSPPPEAEMETSLELALGFGAFFLIVLLSIGVLLVLTTSLQRNAVRFREGVALSAGAAVLALGPLTANSLVRPSTVPATVLLSSGLFVLAIRRYPIFEAPPVARIAGRDRLIEEMADAVVVVDREERIRDLNPAGERSFDTERSDVLGEPLDALLPSTIDLPEVAGADEPVQVRTAADATLAVTANRITDVRGRSFGYLLVCRDVTDRQRRERRLGVLNQLLTGAVSDRMAAVADEAATVAASERDADSATEDADEEPDPARVGAEIRRETTAVVDLVARTREIERALAAGGSGAADVASVVRTVAVPATEDADVDLEIAMDDAPPAAAIDAAVLEAILETLLADALEHGREVVELEVVDGDRTLEIAVTDDRPVDPDEGATSAESGVIGNDVQSPGELSAEMARLAAQHVGGDVSVHVPEPGVRRAVLEVPTADAASSKEIESTPETGAAEVVADGETGTGREGGDRR
ncbi:PAS sensor protein [Natronococcus pandeyae]|uniref:PAS sensor protein n=1 Tax=Natronococcus pandeyae TaxID=2055836 RepID=A0A8J8TRE7_9EURY|nr:histidine kinase N-terminal 7TM domain-containing protein [Natronococcus pandeyae]TYL37900.1 PAS sensor protein [Natronococcus pandeyae]